MENPSKSEVIGRCGGDENPRSITHNRQQSNAKIKIKNRKYYPEVISRDAKLILHANTDLCIPQKVLHVYTMATC